MTQFKAINIEKSNKDVFGAYLCKDIEFDREHRYDIPYVDSKTDIELPKKLIAYGNLGTDEIVPGSYVHFYQLDYIFDGPYGVWNSLVYNRRTKKGFNLEKFKDISGIITPDYSVYYDMPEAMRIWNTYRSRVVGYFFNRIGIPAIANVRWTDEESYEYSFAGLHKNEVVAVSTLGCLRSNNDKKLFMAGLSELIKRIEPKTIVLYGSLSKEVEDLLNKNNQKYEFFPSEISRAHGGKE